MEVSGFDGASILIARGVISTASIARGCASGTGAIGALSLMNASDGHGCETCRACLACRANGFGCAYLCVALTCTRAFEPQRQLKFWLRVESLAHLAVNTHVSEHKRNKTLQQRGVGNF